MKGEKSSLETLDYSESFTGYTFQSKIQSEKPE